jgi:hypothetical protein
VSRRKRLPEDEARWFFQQLALTLDFCHKRKVGYGMLLCDHRKQSVPGELIWLMKATSQTEGEAHRAGNSEAPGC